MSDEEVCVTLDQEEYIDIKYEVSDFEGVYAKEKDDGNFDVCGEEDDLIKFLGMLKELSDFEEFSGDIRKAKILEDAEKLFRNKLKEVL